MSDEKDDKWEMPKPVFRSTGGSVPRNLEDTISLSFAPNKEPVGPDEDDDILGIMSPIPSDELYQHSNQDGSDNILETGAVAEMAPVHESTERNDGIESEQPATINVTANEKIREPKPIDPRRADLLTYIAMVVIGVGLFIAAIYYYFWPPPPVR